MANQANTNQVNNFIGGLNTEASPLNFPPNASLDEANFVLNHDGTRQRRLGINHESYGGYHAFDVSNSYQGQFKGYRWDSVGGDSTLTIQVIQMENCCVFLDNRQDVLGNPPWGCIELPVTGNKKFDFTVVNGDLVVATGETNPFVVEYVGNGQFRYELIKIKIRDLFGVEDGLRVDQRPSGINDKHDYNLRNQGWPNEFYCGEKYDYRDPVPFFRHRIKIKAYPSNADEFQYGIVPVKDPENNQPDEKFKPASLFGAETGTTQTPKGHFIIDAFSRGKSRGYEPYLDGGGSTDPVEEIKEELHIWTGCLMDGDGNTTCSTCEFLKESNGDIHKYYLGSKAGEAIIDFKITAKTLAGTPTNLPRYELNTDSGGKHYLIFPYDQHVPCADGEPMWFVNITFIGIPDDGVDGGKLIPQDRETGRPSTVAAMGNRIFYAGIQSKIIDGDRESVNYTGMVFYSKVANTLNDLHKCYQLADPTSRKISDLVATDGGHINITECSNILKIIPIGQSLVIIAENGIWEIKGGEVGFLATEHIINKISDIGCINADSIVVVEESIMYWTESSIQHINRNKYGDLTSENITETKIRSLVVKTDTRVIVGFYDRIKKTARWLIDKYNTELVYDLNVQAFYKNTFGKRWLRGYVDVPEYEVELDYQDIQVGSDIVYVKDQEVVYGAKARGVISSGIKYITIDFDKKYLTFSLYKDDNFLDWNVFRYESFLITGFNTGGDMLSKKTTPYVLFYLSRTEDGFEYNDNGVLLPTHPSSCWVQSMWDWSGSGNSGKWGAPFQAYRYLRPYIPSGLDDTFDYGENVIVTKNKILGRGKSLSIKIVSEYKKDLQILGWASTVTSTTAV